MPFILVHPLPPPRYSPYYPSLPTFTTSSRSIAHFFHSHGWRAKHIYVPSFQTNASSSAPSLTSSPSSSASRASSLSVQSNGYIDATSLSLSYPPAPDDINVCCRASTGTSIVSCGSIIELHCYNMPIETALFHGPFATERQINYLLYYARGHVEFESDEGVVDLRVVNEEAMALKKEKDKKFFSKEQKRGRRIRRMGESGRVLSRCVRCKTVQRNRKHLVEVLDHEVDEELDEEIDEELGKQWELAERALLASGDLEWDRAGKTLRKTRDLDGL